MYRKNNKAIKNILIFILFLLILAISLLISNMYSKIDIIGEPTTIERTSLTIDEAEDKNMSISNMLESTMHSVVGISKIRNTGLTALDVNSSHKIGIGSGVIISKKGYILTNEHVSGDKYSTCYVTLADGEILTANVVWADSTLDLSIIKVSKQFADFVPLGNSENIKIGETVFAIGNPIGMEFQRTVTSGIISAKNRTITFEENSEKFFMDNLIQTDATINPGNSGGPLLNIYGEIIGINTVKITSAEGIGFAVPINIVKPIISKLESTGKFEEASIGILGYDSNVINYLNYDAKIDSGIFVLQNFLDGSSSSSQILAGDNIVKIDDFSINKMIDLKSYVFSKNPGDSVKLTLLRNNKEMEIFVILNKKI